MDLRTLLVMIQTIGELDMVHLEEMMGKSYLTYPKVNRNIEGEVSQEYQLQGPETSLLQRAELVVMCDQYFYQAKNVNLWSLDLVLFTLTSVSQCNSSSGKSHCQRPIFNNEICYIIKISLCLLVLSPPRSCPTPPLSQQAEQETTHQAPSIPIPSQKRCFQNRSRLLPSQKCKFV